jgi:acetyl esterase/lipase
MKPTSRCRSARAVALLLLLATTPSAPLGAQRLMSSSDLPTLTSSSADIPRVASSRSGSRRAREFPRRASSMLQTRWPFAVCLPWLRLPTSTHAAGSPMRLAPIGLPQVLIVGAHDATWAPIGRSYFAKARAAGDTAVQLIEAPESGHFELIAPASTTWPIVIGSLKTFFAKLR